MLKAYTPLERIAAMQRIVAGGARDLHLCLINAPSDISERQKIVDSVEKTLSEMADSRMQKITATLDFYEDGDYLRLRARCPPVAHFDVDFPIDEGEARLMMDYLSSWLIRKTGTSA